MNEKEMFEENEMNSIADEIKNGYFSIITANGSTWHIEINFDYNAHEGHSAS